MNCTNCGVIENCNQGDSMFTRKTKALHEDEMQQLQKKKQLAKMKLEERKLKAEIFWLRFPFHIHFQFNKFIVVFCLITTTLYTVAAIFLQKYTMMELSPTLTTCVFAFFGTELLGLAGIKIFDTKFSNSESDISSYNTESFSNE